MATETLFTPRSRESAEDRWEGLMLDRVDPEAPSDLSNRLTAIVVEMMGGMGRVPMKADYRIGDLEDAICAWLVQWAMAGGVSPTEDREVTFSHIPFMLQGTPAA